MAIDWTKVIITADDDTVAMAAGQVLLLASGVPGESASVEVAETVTLDPLEDAYVENLGDNRNVRLKFGIPRGQSGVWGGIGGTLEDQADLKHALDAKADIIHTSASGSLVHITDGAPYPVDSLTVGIDPVQDLHGYDSPWPAGGGKNKAPITEGNVTVGSYSWHVDSDGYITQTSESDARNWVYSESQWFITLPAGTYKLLCQSKTYAGTAISVILYDSSNNAKTSVGLTAVETKSSTFTLAEETALGIYGKNQGGIYRVAIYSDTSISTYQPYSNICPISGHTQAVVTRTGKNLFARDSTNIANNKCLNSSGQLYDNTNWRVYYVSVKPDATYSISGITSNEDNVYFYWMNDSKQPVSAVGKRRTQYLGITAPANASYLAICCVYNLESLKFDLPTVQLELGSTATAYEPYQGTSVTISLGSTVYGAQLDAVAGTLTVDRASFTWGTGESTRLSNSKVCVLDKSDVVTIDPANQTTLIGAICDKLPSGTWAQLAGGSTSMAGCVYGNALGFRIAGYTTLEEYETFLASNPLQFVYLLKTPVTITGLTPAQISLLLGENNVWSDTGDTTVGYRADTKLYIDSKLAAAIAELQALILEH